MIKQYVPTSCRVIVLVCLNHNETCYFKRLSRFPSLSCTLFQYFTLCEHGKTRGCTGTVMLIYLHALQNSRRDAFCFSVAQLFSNRMQLTDNPTTVLLSQENLTSLKNDDHYLVLKFSCFQNALAC